VGIVIIINSCHLFSVYDLNWGVFLLIMVKKENQKIYLRQYVECIKFLRIIHKFKKALDYF